MHARAALLARARAQLCSPGMPISIAIYQASAFAISAGHQFREGEADKEARRKMRSNRGNNVTKSRANSPPARPCRALARAAPRYSPAIFYRGNIASVRPPARRDGGTFGVLNAVAAAAAVVVRPRGDSLKDTLDDRLSDRANDTRGVDSPRGQESDVERERKRGEGGGVKGMERNPVICGMHNQDSAGPKCARARAHAHLFPGFPVLSRAPIILN